jgi:hydroxypyruvate reductase
MVAVEGARAAAEGLGYRVHVVEEPVVGEARLAGEDLVSQTLKFRAAGDQQSLCVIAAGETTVRVIGKGKGGRNQELALSMLPHIHELGEAVVAASIGTDGVDGPTDAAGALVDVATASRAASAGLDPGRYLDDNDTYTFFDRLGDLIRTGPTHTNVGDLQIILTT